jgi:hypothetical protein
MGNESEPGVALLISKIAEGLAVFAGIASTVWTFLYLLGESFEYGEGIEVATALIPAIAVVLFLWFVRQKKHPFVRTLLLDFFVAAFVAYLVMQFVVVKVI